MQIYSVGDNAVYAGHGVGKIVDILTTEMYGRKQTFYRIEIVETGLKVMVPTDNAELKGLRPIISSDEADKVLDIVKEKKFKIDNQTWNRRYREYMEKIKTGSVFEIAEVFRDLYLLKGEKELSFGEKKMLDMARGLLLRELALAKSEEELSKEEEIANIFDLKKA